jgi:hypothetical protein
MKTETRYLYLDNKTQKTSLSNGLKEEHFTVIKVETFDDNYNKAEKKARTIAQKLGLKLAGGSFGEPSKPYNFESNYTVINCPKNTKIQPNTEQDNYIIGLIENGY